MFGVFHKVELVVYHNYEDLIAEEEVIECLPTFNFRMLLGVPVDE